MARIIAYVRVATTSFVFLPLIGWDRLEHPAIALGAALAASAEATWFLRRVRRLKTMRDSFLVWGDVVFCIVLMIVGSRAAFPMQRNVLTTELIPFALASPACVGFGLPFGAAGITAVSGLMLTWGLAVIPDVTLKLVSDLLGFAVWYVVALVVGQELRSLSRQTAQAQDVAVESARRLSEQQAEIVRHQMHDVLLPIVEQIASGTDLSDDFVGRVRREASRARRVLDPRASRELGLRSLLHDVCETFTETGVQVEAVIAIRAEPPAEVGAAITAATREALNNVRKHARSRQPVLVRADGSPGRVEVVVRDRGVGFDPATVPAGGGIGITFLAIRRYGCTCELESSPGAGTKVTITWHAAEAEDGNDG
jgi:anti-sigma regulatory factor (Ser/Thr protein kinase)